MALTVLTIAIMVGPLAYTAYIYRDNLMGMVMPPQISGLLGDGGDNSGFPSLSSNFQAPTPVGEPQYFPENHSYAFAYNFTNPLPEDISVDGFSAELYSTDGVYLGSVGLNNPLHINAGGNGIIDISGGFTQQAIDYFKSQNSTSIDVNFKNIDVNVDGFNFHLDDPSNLMGSIPLPIGDLR